ncbi:MAG: VanW family protein [Chloroflexi bacterium]|nr:VanW family protein [Chloroflexota bacterium]
MDAVTETNEPLPGPLPTVPDSAVGLPRRRGARRFAVAFLFGVLGVLAVSAGALAALESSNTGRVLPGIHAGTVDLSGLSPSEARDRLVAAYATLGDGELVLTAAGTSRTITFASLSRRLDVDTLVDRAMAVGRSGAPVERIASNLRNMVRGVEIAPEVVFDASALRAQVAAFASETAIAPVDATVALVGEVFSLTKGSDGRSVDVEAAVRGASQLLSDVGASPALLVTVPTNVVAPDVTTDAAAAARDAAARIAVDIELVAGEERWTIAGSDIRNWIGFGTTPDGRYAPIVAPASLEAGLAKVAAAVAQKPVNASFLTGTGNTVVGVSAGRNGRALDIPATTATLTTLIGQRALGLSVSRAPINTTTVEPELSTAEATRTAPLMEEISSWTTWFPIGIKNGQGANIWIPARDIDGAVVMPGAWFDFWKAVGPVTRERGYKDGGAIINGKTEPQGALAGGICSTSTTLFNAALRAGLEMGARRNHFYYIDRYPLGLDATVFQSNSGTVQTMSFRNDTANPILIRGTGWSVGSKGYVKFALWSVPTGRTVTLSKPKVENVKLASDSIVYTTDLKPGVKERVEYPVDGKDVWVTRTVTDSAGAVLHQETYTSRYTRITGILRIGVAASPGTAPDSTAAPTP